MDERRRQARGRTRHQSPAAREQIAALEKKLHDLKTRGDKPVPEVVAAEAKVAEANAELEKANKAVEQAKAEQTAKEAEVERRKVEAAKADPPADIQARLADAREVRGKARAAFTNATQTIKAKACAGKRQSRRGRIEETGPAGTHCIRRRAPCETESARGGQHRTRETVAARKRDHDQLQADIAAKKEELTRLDKEPGAPTSGTKSKLKAQIKTLAAELKTAEANAKSWRKIWLPKRQLKQLTAEAEKTRTVSTAVIQQSKL